MSIVHVVLLGPMASGKSTLGQALAEILHVEFVDSDMSIIESMGANAAQIASTDGVTELHRLEKEALSTALARSSTSVIAAAASVVDDEATRKELMPHLCIWVEADAETLSRRRGSAPHRRVMSEAEAADLNRTRRSKAADLLIGRVDTTDSTIQEVSALAIEILTPRLVDQIEGRS